jgi:uncharacterized membrane protein YvbJ
MKQCPVCQKPVSDFALECPHCKAKMDTKPQLTNVNHTEPVEKVIVAKKASPIKADYLSVVMLTLILFFITQIFGNTLAKYALASAIKNLTYVIMYVNARAVKCNEKRTLLRFTRVGAYSAKRNIFVILSTEKAKRTVAHFRKLGHRY